jgi:hypothetical protein
VVPRSCAPEFVGGLVGLLRVGLSVSGIAAAIGLSEATVYVGDRAAGQAKGQALKLNGRYWYVLSPAGTVIRTKLS